MFKLGKKKSLNSNLDQKLVQSLKGSRIPSLTQLKYLKKYLNGTEQKLLAVSLLVLLSAGVFFGVRFYYKHLTIVPVFGGEYIEGEVGSPKYINPLYASEDEVDSDLAALVYSALYKRDTKGLLVPDLVESAAISEEGKTYTVKIRPGVLWHNGSVLTSNDVLFTFNAIKDPQYKSPLRTSFNGVEASVTDDQTIVFKLKEAYSGFPELLTFGILPSDVWGNMAPSTAGLTELNLKPIGSGPYKFKSLLKFETGSLKMISLEANNDYYNGKPFITDLKFQFFPSDEEAQAALHDGSIDGVGYYADQFTASANEKSFLKYNKLGTSQAKGLFFNLKSNILSDVKVRQAIALAINKERILNELGSAVTSLEAPILPQSQFYSNEFKKYAFNKEQSRSLLEGAGWKLVDITDADMAQVPELLKSTDQKKKKLGESYKVLGLGKWYFKGNDFLIAKLSTAEITDNKQIAEKIQADLLDVNIKAVVELIPANQIQSDVIKTRDYEILLTGKVLTADADPYLYWHSSQIGSDGLNLSNLNNKEIDKLIEDGRLNADIAKRKIDYTKFLNIFAEQVPAVYLYARNYMYVQSHKIKNLQGEVIYFPSDRFANVKDWYIETGYNFNW